jgi:hypothetical protein
MVSRAESAFSEHVSFVGDGTVSDKVNFASVITD